MFLYEQIKPIEQEAYVTPSPLLRHPSLCTSYSPNIIASINLPSGQPRTTSMNEHETLI